MEPSTQSRRLRGNPRGQLPASLRAQDLPINEVLTMLQNVHIWDTNLRKRTQNHNAGVPNRDYNAAIVAQADSITQLHGRACDLAIQTPYLFAHGILEIAYDTALLTNLALTNKAMWRKCKNALDMEFIMEAWAPSSGLAFRSATGKLDDPSTEMMRTHHPTSSTSCSTDKCMNGITAFPASGLQTTCETCTTRMTILQGRRRSEGARKDVHPKPHRQ